LEDGAAPGSMKFYCHNVDGDGMCCPRTELVE
jgi:hypothetical protein